MSAKGDDLERIAALVNFEQFRAELAQAVARSPADGNTLLITTSSIVITAGTVPNLPYDPRRDLEPLYFLGPVQTMHGGASV